LSGCPVAMTERQPPCGPDEDPADRGSGNS
jgi:hypothetical protein